MKAIFVNRKNALKLLRFIPELIGLWVVIIVVTLIISRIKSDYVKGNLLEITKSEQFWNRVEIYTIYLFFFLAVSSITLRSRLKYGQYFWPGTFIFGFINGIIFFGFFAYSESHILIGRNVFTIIMQLSVYGILWGSLIGGLAYFIGFLINSVINIFAIR